MEITITRALAELKLVEKRINKQIESSKFIAVAGNNKFIDQEKFNKDALASYQSINDLIKFRNKLKSEIISSNGKTIVKVGSNSYSVADAIERKKSIEFEKQLLQKFQQQRTESKTLVDNHEALIRNKLDRLLEVEFGKDVKSNADNVNAISKTYLDNNKIILVDPLQLDEKIKNLENDIDEFEKNVDFVLSESNAKTTVLIGK